MKNIRVGIVVTQHTIDAFKDILETMRCSAPGTIVSTGDAWRAIIDAGMMRLRSAGDAPVHTDPTRETKSVAPVSHSDFSAINAIARKKKAEEAVPILGAPLGEWEKAEKVVPILGAPLGEEEKAEKVVPILGAPLGEEEKAEPYVQVRCSPEQVHPSMAWLAAHERAEKAGK